MKALMRVCALVAVSLLAVATPAAAQWASLTPNNEFSSKVQHGPTQEAAERRAMSNCEAVSRTCASRPASTSDPRDVFVTFCCTKPRFGCQTTPAESVEAARPRSMEVFSDAGFSNCSLKQTLPTGLKRR